MPTDYDQSKAAPGGPVVKIGEVKVQRMIYAGQRLKKSHYLEDEELEGFWAVKIDAYSWTTNAPTAQDAASYGLEQLEKVDEMKAASMRRAVRASAATMTVHNCTGKELRIWEWDEYGDKHERVLPPERFQSGVTTRVVEAEVIAGMKRFSVEAKANPFPPERESVVYIVDQITKMTLPERKDLFVVMGPEQQEDGRVVYKGIR